MAAKRLVTADRVLILLVGVLAVAVRGVYVYYNQDELIKDAKPGPASRLAASLVDGEGFKDTAPTAPANPTDSSLVERMRFMAATVTIRSTVMPAAMRFTVKVARTQSTVARVPIPSTAVTVPTSSLVIAEMMI